MNPSAIRAETLSRLSAWGIQANVELPLLEEESALNPPSEATVARRAAAASCVAAVAFGWPVKAARAYLEETNLSAYLSPSESVWLRKRSVSKQEQAQFGWIVESLQFLAWALSRFPEPSHLSFCDDSLATLFPPKLDYQQYLASIQLKPLFEIRQEADTLYMLHWSFVELGISSGNQDFQTVQKLRSRRRAAEWIIGVEANWDDVSLDT